MLMILGGGVIGSQLALHAAHFGMDVVLHDVTDERLECARRNIERTKRFNPLFGTLSKSPEIDPLARIHYTTNLPYECCTEFLVEAVYEEPEIKVDVLQRAHSACAEQVIFASTTSAVPIGWLAARCGRPDRTVGTHFMNPVTKSAAVEFVAAETTSAATRERTDDWLRALGKRPVPVGDGPGFVSNRVLMLMLNEAIAVHAGGVADAARVDEVFTACMGHPMGPLALADLIGLDTVLRTLQVLRRFTGEARFEPAPLLRELVDSGYCGQKSGRGLYDYGIERPTFHPMPV